MSTDDGIHVHCPRCSNKRLFDCGLEAEGVIRIKCPSCREVSVINLQHVTEEQKRKRFAAYKRNTEKFI